MLICGTIREKFKGYQGGKPGASGGGIFLIEEANWSVFLTKNGVVGKRSGGILFHPAQLKWIQDHIGNFSVKPADLKRKKNRRRKPKDKPSRQPETLQALKIPEWQTVANKEQQGTVTIREEKVPATINCLQRPK